MRIIGIRMIATEKSTDTDESVKKHQSIYVMKKSRPILKITRLKFLYRDCRRTCELPSQQKCAQVALMSLVSKVNEGTLIEVQSSGTWLSFDKHFCGATGLPVGCFGRACGPSEQVY